MFTRNTTTALLVSIATTLLALLVFGFIKGRFTGTQPVRQRFADGANRERSGGRRFHDRPSDILKQWPWSVASLSKTLGLATDH